MIPKRKGQTKEVKRDVFGRDLSYFKSYSQYIENLKDINVYSADFESGYTPLHITLKRGYFKRAFQLFKKWKDEQEFLSHKLGGHVMNQIDREGFTPFELYMVEYRRLIKKYPKYISYRVPGSTTASNKTQICYYEDINKLPLGRKLEYPNLPTSVEELIYLKSSKASHALTFGVNINFQLGTGTTDARKNLFQLSVHQLEEDNIILSDIGLKNIFITRYHSLIVTNGNNIFVTGSTGRGRVGNGVIDTPQTQYTKLRGLPTQNIKDICTSDHHTMVLCNDNEIYTWGWNYFCQLGHSVTNKPSDKSYHTDCSSIPKRIGFLPGVEIISISCSKIHSACATKTGRILLWGLNVGQMGTSNPVHLSHDSVYMDVEGYLTTKPVEINLGDEIIEQILCTEFTTFVRTRNNILHVYSNYSSKTFRLLLPRPSRNIDRDNFTYFAPREIPSNVIDMKCKNPFGNNLTLKYSCGRIGTITSKEESIYLWSTMKNTPHISLCWTPNYDFKRCVDFDVSSKGELIICTAGGEVYKYQDKDTPLEKIFSTKLTSGKIVRVSCDSQFGSFALLKNEFDSIPIMFPKDSLLYDFSRFCDVVPGTTIKNDLGNEIAGVMARKYFDYNDYSLNKLQNHELLDSDENAAKISYRSQQAAELNTKILSEIGKSNINGRKTFDIVFKDKITSKIVCTGHKLLLMSRCSTLMNLLLKEKFFSLHDNQIVLELVNNIHESNWEIEISGKLGPDVIKEVIYYLYTDIKPSNQKVSRLLLEMVDHSLHYSSLHNSLSNLYYDIVTHKSSDSLNFVDTKILLNNGCVFAHSLILSVRCSYFKIMFEENWYTIDSDGYKLLDLKSNFNVTKDIFAFVIKYIYGFPYDLIFQDAAPLSYTENLQTLLDLLEITDFLNLQSFKTYLEAEIDKYIEGETVILILLNAIAFNCDLLETKCNWFICKNIAILFSKNNIPLIEEHFTERIWDRLELCFSELSSDSNTVTEFMAWYYESHYDWLALFNGNLSKFNEKFIDPHNCFVPVFDLKCLKKKPIEEKTKRRKSMNIHKPRSKTLPCSKSSLTCEEQQNLIENKETSSSWAQNNSHSMVIDDSNEFVEVTRKAKRKNSKNTEKKPELRNIVNKETSSKVVLHKNVNKDNQTLVSLTDADNAKREQHKNNSLNQKLWGTFRKTSQKDRKKIIDASLETNSKSEMSEQPVWGKAISTGTEPIEKLKQAAIVSKKSNLPSLYDPNSPKIISDTKKSKNEIIKHLPQTDSIHMPYVRASQHVPLNAIDTQFEKDQLKKRKSKKQMQEEMEAVQFERWFEEESERIQRQMKKDDKSVNNKENDCINTPRGKSKTKNQNKISQTTIEIRKKGTYTPE
ncbi:hypothetical protein TPHA_0I00720 [Tetrapisispora phaffii CBS 4417]|uniref:BTB domain-containing protein n=1 Tax=Tetrapisispora phaffii (strain ATCC 24235 / CBS 4417 / NBRC 1672 / NRRL Y-8282 / UCD 70-5) TaxID=1071381 RepID=G8BXF0_TETPH|nr:hypothetical protein TPHA_0I00720 [Tetrapisispora phaffii CBS 4417]CCE64578.1 hypothetical protein TPHA_0I00720 [Tetrapisispora phaffii CBS 4417]